MGDVIDFTAGPQTTAIVPQVQDLRAQVLAAVISDGTTYARATELLLTVATLKAKVADTFDPHVRRAHEAHKALLADRQRYTAPLDDAERELKARIGAYQRAEEEKRRAEEARLQALARQEEEERQLAEAVALEAGGDPEAAEAALALPVVAPVVVLQSSVPKIAGIASRETWNFRITNASLIPREYLMPDEKAIGAMVRARKGNTRIPGVEVYATTGIAVKRS